MKQARTDLGIAIDAQNAFDFARARMAMTVVARHLRVTEEELEADSGVSSKGIRTVIQ